MTEFQYLTSDLEALADLTNYQQWILDEISPFFGNRIAEVGAGIGTFTELLVAAHLHPHALTQLETFEPAVNLFKRLRDRLENRHATLIQDGRLIIKEGYFARCSERYDTVIMINVLEHIQDDLDSLRNIYEALTPGGYVIVFVPALSWLYSAFDKTIGHHRRYEKDSLKGLFMASGFDVVKVKYMDTVGVLPWYLFNVLGGATSIYAPLAKCYDRWVIPVTRWIETYFQPGLGKNILIVGNKKMSA